MYGLTTAVTELPRCGSGCFVSGQIESGLGAIAKKVIQANGHGDVQCQDGVLISAGQFSLERRV